MKRISLKEDNSILKDVGDLYLSAFPENERPPLEWLLKAFHASENNSIYGYYESELFIGFSYVTTYKDIAYVCYLAVSESQRNKGWGTNILNNIKDLYKDYVILLCYEEVDDKYLDNELRKRRKSFYERNGFKDNGLKTREGPVVYESGRIGEKKVDFSSYTKIFDLCYGSGASQKYLKCVKEY